jgi:hypothetical protein
LVTWEVGTGKELLGVGAAARGAGTTGKLAAVGNFLMDVVPQIIAMKKTLST